MVPVDFVVLCFCCLFWHLCFRVHLIARSKFQYVKFSIRSCFSCSLVLLHVLLWPVAVVDVLLYGSVQSCYDGVSEKEVFQGPWSGATKEPHWQ